MAIFDELIDDLEDAAHKAVTAANVATKQWLISRAPVDDDEMRNGIRVLKEVGRQGDQIDSNIFVKGTQKLNAGYGRTKEVPNQLVANATNVKTGWANGSLEFWEQELQANIDEELAKI